MFVSNKDTQCHLYEVPETLHNQYSLFKLELLCERDSGSAQHVSRISDKVGAAVWRCRCRGVEVHHGQARELSLNEACKH